MKSINLCLFLFLCSSFILSEEKQYDEVVTVVSKIPKEYYKVTSTVDLIGIEELERYQPTSVIGLLSNNLAIDTSSNGGPGQVSSIFLRGSNSNHSLVKVNGVKINPSTAGGASIYNLDTSLISNIEIGSGPLSSIHGSEAIGGVINISTKNVSDVDALLLGYGVGPDDHSKKYLQGNLSYGNSSYNATVLNRDSNGFPSLSNSELNRGYKNRSFIGDWTHTKEKTDLSLSTWSSKGTVEYLIFGSPVSQDYKNEATAAELSYELKEDLLVMLSINSAKDLIEQNNPNFLSALDFTKTKRSSYEILFHKPYQNLASYSFGYVLEEEDVNYSSYGTLFQKALETKASFGTFEYTQNNNTLITSVRNSKHDLYGKQMSWNIGFLRNFSKNWSVNLAAGKAFRSPNSSELYGFGSNLNLKPEESRSKEIGFTKRIPESSMSVVYFNNETLNLINFDYVDYVLKNIEKSSNSGFEIRYEWLNKSFEGNFIVRLQDPKDQDNKLLLRRSKKSFSLNLSKELFKYTFGFNVSAFDQKIDFGDINLPGYVLLNVAINKEVAQNLDMSLKIENIGDKDYFTAASSNSYYLNQDRSFWVKLNYKLR